MVEISVEHILMFVIVAFLLYHLVGRYGCIKRVDGFSVGGGEKECIGETCKRGHCEPCDRFNPFGKHCGTNLTCTWINNMPECPGKEGFYCMP